MIEPPDIRYTTSGDLSIAYHVLGEGPVDILLVPGQLYTIEAIWQEWGLVRFVESLARFSRDGGAGGDPRDAHGAGIWSSGRTSRSRTAADTH